MRYIGKIWGEGGELICKLKSKFDKDKILADNAQSKLKVYMCMCVCNLEEWR